MRAGQVVPPPHPHLILLSLSFLTSTLTLLAIATRSCCFGRTSHATAGDGKHGASAATLATNAACSGVTSIGCVDGVCRWSVYSLSAKLVAIHPWFVVCVFYAIRCRKGCTSAATAVPRASPSRASSNSSLSPTTSTC